MRRPPPPRSPRWCWPAAWPSTAPACSPRPTPGGIVTEDSPILPDDEYGLSKWTAYQAAGEPALLTVGIIAANGAPLVVPPPPKGTIWVVEGVSALVAAAARRVPVPVVCRGGTPSVAVTRLVSAAAVAVGKSLSRLTSSHAACMAPLASCAWLRRQDDRGVYQPTTTSLQQPKASPSYQNKCQTLRGTQNSPPPCANAANESARKPA